MSDPVEVLDFWLREIGPEGWYAGAEAIDGACRTQMGDMCKAAREGMLDHWVDGTVGTLAYLILTDQMSRNIHRGTALAFASDPLARAAARKAVEMGWDLDAPEPERQFFYMPFEHSEDPEDQALAVTLLTERMPSSSDTGLHARVHQEMIRRFGRFPLRNAALGRASTPEEQDFLANGGYMAVLNDLRGSHASDA